MKLVKFYTQTCGPCKAIRPIVEQVLQNHPELEYEEYDCSDGVPDQFAQIVRSVPTLLVVKDKEPNEIIVGVKPLAELEQLIYG